MNVLITGASGQLGKELQHTAPDHLKIYARDSKSLDITEAKQVNSVFDQIHPDVVVNAAAYTAVDNAESDRETAFAVNASGPRNIARACKAMGSRLIHISTDFVFSGASPLPYLPDDRTAPINYYGKSKLHGEQAVIEETDGEGLIFRTAWLYSNHGHNFVKNMIQLMREREQLAIVYDQIGSPTWARPLAQIIWKAVVHYQQLKGIFHWSDAGVASWYDFALVIQSKALATGSLSRAIPISPIRTDQYPAPAARPANSILDCSKSWEELSVTPQHWMVSLNKCLEENQSC